MNGRLINMENYNNNNENENVLEKYGRDIVSLAREGKIDPVIGRDEEIRRIIKILSRKTKNNPVLIGEPGVGKTAIIEGLAKRIVANDVPSSGTAGQTVTDAHSTAARIAHRPIPSAGGTSRGYHAQPSAVQRTLIQSQATDVMGRTQGCRSHTFCPLHGH